MESRRPVLAALLALVAIAVLTAALGIHRILLLSSDLDDLVARDLPLERAVGELLALARDRSRALAEDLEDLDFMHRNEVLSVDLSNRIERFSSALRSQADGSHPAAKALNALQEAEAAFRAAEGTTRLDRSRAVEAAADALSGPVASLTDQAATHASRDERRSLAWLIALGMGGIGLGAILARYVLGVFSEVQTLRVLVPICAGCFEVRNDPPFWRSIDRYLEDRQHTQLAHGRCPRCETARAEGEAGH